MKNIIYIVMEDWRIDSGESGIESTVFSNFESALDYFNKLKDTYNNDYNTLSREDVNIDEDVQEENKIASIEVSFDDDYDYYKIWIDEKIIKN